MKPNPRRRFRLLILVVAGSLAIAACGSSSGGGTKTSTTASASSNRAKLAACLKQHGVTLPTRRPGAAGGGGGYFGGSSGTTGSGAPPTGGAGAPPAGGFGGSAGSGAGPYRNSSKFRTAFKACGGSFGQFRSGAGRARGRFSAAVLDKFVTCVRKHGYDLPKPNTSGSGAIFPRSIESNKKFQAAAKSCTSVLRPSTPPGTTSSS
ncbi:MAG TPA: hypothetical protein VG405_06170 [Solirubrobacteraceae bacterium]|nr:hypothetical protein [Solirubrobacteraceae bacterium]